MEHTQADHDVQRLIAERTGEMAALYAQSERRARELDALYRAESQVHRHLRLGQVLQSLVAVVVEILHADETSVQVMASPHSRRSGGSILGRAFWY